MQKTDYAPIAIFAYNRPDSLTRMMASLRECKEFEHSTITIFVDGPKNEKDKAAVDRVRHLVQNLRLPNVTNVFSETNKGLRQSIYSGVNEICAGQGRVIVLEDDLVLSPIALRYFNDGLDYYKDDVRIWSIAGYLYDVPELRDSRKAIALPFAHPWGWATWARAWSRFSLDNRPRLTDLESAAFCQMFDVNGIYPFAAQLQQSIAGRVDSWFIHWYYTIFQNGGWSIFPPRRVLDNFGISQGTHGSALNPHEYLVERPTLLNEEVIFESMVSLNYAALDQLKRCRELRVQRFIATAGRAKRRLRALIKG